MIQIVNWKNYLKFPDEARLSPEAKDMICRLLCDVDNRLGGRGGDDIKVSLIVDKISIFLLFLLKCPCTSSDCLVSKYILVS